MGCERRRFIKRVLKSGIVALAVVAFLVGWLPSAFHFDFFARRTTAFAVQQTPSVTLTELASTQEEPLEWPKPRFEERVEERERMVLEQIAARGVDDAAVLDAMRQVPRHLFVPEREARSAYADRPLPIGHGQTISQPYIVALMTELLEVKPGDKILEIGTGSGYQAAVITELTPYVYTIEIIEALGEIADERLTTLGYATVSTNIADGYYGWEEEAPFDGIIVTCAAGHIPPPLLAQLARGGRMVIPVGSVYDVQYLVRVTKDEDGTTRSEALLPVRFVPMTGRAEEGP